MKTTIAFLASTLLISNTAAFAPSNNGVGAHRATSSSLQMASFDPLNLADGNGNGNDNSNVMASVSKIAAASAAALALSPVAAVAEELADDYEYGAVNAPIGLAWGAGVLAVLTALLPLALQGGEEAFEEMREKDSGSWGSGNSDRLTKRK
mmetsp:Transcript_8980/g.13398  ORF Transcript_8980/g.13398 Transcript_8980/m.13398 type:complete len:151 (+) Transcript_8980:167-619(+)